MRTQSRSVWIGSLIAITIVAVGVGLLLRNKSGDKPRIAIFLYAQHPVIKEINVGFRKAVDSAAAAKGTQFEYVERNADGDATQANAIANYFRGTNVDVILVAGLPAAQALKSAGVQCPVVFAAVPDPVAAGLVPKLVGHESTFTGTRYFPPVGITLDVFRKAFPGATNVAVLHNPGEANSLVVTQEFVAEAKKRSLKVTDLGASNATEIEAALRTMISESPQGLFLPPDNLAYASLDRILAQSKAANIPVFSCTKAAVEKGAIFSVASDYETIGEISGELAARIVFDGTKPQQVDVVDIKEGHLYVKKGDPRGGALQGIQGYELVLVP